MTIKKGPDETRIPKNPNFQFGNFSWTHDLKNRGSRPSRLPSGQAF